ncbi:uncharacterized protein CLUP02_03489 [Colletotrichum lupini]|uniref:Uncharacterized protein n=1 Tax=Colletotrichum lupini TaxID=145971 RepID=A0A9Q8SIX9_9PEZI|nr:uncharacterized protein CLUP02_03489 [Colletotrichum lupini]UQC78015.1 hypothetical protein CLUP02_03489 [Colletotrichum lupini]
MRIRRLSTWIGVDDYTKPKLLRYALMSEAGTEYVQHIECLQTPQSGMRTSARKTWSIPPQSALRKNGWREATCINGLVHRGVIMGTENSTCLRKRSAVISDRYYSGENRASLPEALAPSSGVGPKKPTAPALPGRCIAVN